MLVRKYIPNDKVRTAIEVHMSTVQCSLHQLTQTMQRQHRQNQKQMQAALKVVEEKQASFFSIVHLHLHIHVTFKKRHSSITCV